MIAGVTGDGSKTGELWQHFIKLNEEIGLKNKLSDNGYEIRVYHDDQCKCHVGLAVSEAKVDHRFTVMELPASEYAAFDVYVARGYDSENSAMEEWLAECGFHRRNLGADRKEPKLTLAHRALSVA